MRRQALAGALGVVAAELDGEALAGAHLAHLVEADAREGLPDRLALRIEHLAPRIDGDDGLH